MINILTRVHFDNLCEKDGSPKTLAFVRHYGRLTIIFDATSVLLLKKGKKFMFYFRVKSDTLGKIEGSLVARVPFPKGRAASASSIVRISAHQR